MSELCLREAVADDAEAIAALHAASWRQTYRGIMAHDYLDGPVFDERRRHWQEKLSAPQAGGFVLLAEDRLGLAGFIAVWPDAEGGASAHIDNLHVDAKRRGQGLGRRLLGAAASRLAKSGRQSACLWVFDANEAALRFYVAMGGAVEERGFERIDGRDVPQTRIVWHDTAALAAARK
jgi:hypothetical protein